MKLVAVLADAAQIDSQGKAYALGLGWTTLPSPTSAISVLAIVEFTADEVPVEFALTIELLLPDGEPISIPTSPGGAPEPFKGVMPAAIDEVPQAHMGDPIRIPFVMNVAAGLPLAPGVHQFRLRVINADSEQCEVEEAIPFRVRSPGESAPTETVPK